MNEKLNRAISDLRRLEENAGPEAADLVDAPILTDWFLAGQCLAGIVTRHPKIRDGDFCVTSIILAIDPDAGWARTFSRFYRLSDRDRRFTD